MVTSKNTMILLQVPFQKKTNDYFEETCPVSLAWQKNSCFIDSLIQCFMSSYPLQQAILESDSTWKISKYCAFFGIASVMNEMEMHRTKEQNFVQIIYSRAVLDIMKAYDESGGDYREFGLGDPMELLDYIVYKVSEIVGNYYHPFIKCVSMARDRVTIIHCRSCGHVLRRRHWSGEEDSLFMKVYPSDDNGWNINQLIKNDMMKKTDTLSGNGMFCECCKEPIRDVMVQDYFNGWEYDASDEYATERVLIVYVLPHMIDGHPQSMLRLKKEDAHIDLSDYVEESISGLSSQYLGELTGYIIQDAHHFVSCIKGIGGKKFYVLDDLKPGEAKDVGEDPCEEWCKPTYMFYTIRKIPKNASSPEDENIQVYAAGSLLMELKEAIGKDQHSVKTKSVRCNDNSEIGDLKCTVEIEDNSVETTEDDKRIKDELERWVYQDLLEMLVIASRKDFSQMRQRDMKCGMKER